MKALIAITLTLLLTGISAHAELTSKYVSNDIIQKILSQGVNEKSLGRILNTMDGKYGTKFTFDAYWCSCPPKGKCTNMGEPMTTGACPLERRNKESRTLEIGYHRYGVSIDFSQPSTAKRFAIIDFETGSVEKVLVAHGKGSSPELTDGKPDSPGDEGKYASVFSNVEGSKMTSLGIYLTGGEYYGGHKETLRMYGLEKSNNEAYDRDIVFHGADYAHASFIEQVNKTLQPVGKNGRLGVSWGCPAVSNQDRKDFLPLLKWGAIIDQFHPKHTPAQPQITEYDISKDTERY